MSPSAADIPDRGPCPPAVALSVVVPCHDEEESLPALRTRLQATLEELGVAYEVVFIDDASRDATLKVLHAIAEDWPAVRIVELVRNAGHQGAITAGMDAATGEYVVTLDADLQDPPELITELYSKATTEHLDAVYAQRSDRSSDTWFKRITANLYYSFAKQITGVVLPHNVGDYRLLSRAALTQLQNLPERKRVYRLLVPWLDLPSGTVPYARQARAAGHSKYNLRKMIGLALDSFYSFSTRPLHAATVLGFMIGGLSLLGLVYVLVSLLLGHAVQGWASMTAAIFFLGSVQLICLGVLGDYIGRIYDEVRHRPIYIRRDSLRRKAEPESTAKDPA